MFGCRILKLPICIDPLFATEYSNGEEKVLCVQYSHAGKM